MRVEVKTASESCPLAAADISSIAHWRNAVARLSVTNFRTKFEDQISEEVLLIPLYNL